jgi:hypothetical protein
MDFSKQKIILCLIAIGSISIILKLSLIDFSIPVSNNDQLFSLRAISYIYGDFEINPKQNPGWPLFLSIFYRLFDSNDFLVYSNITRITSILVSTLAIVPMYLLSRKFYDVKYSLVGASLLAFEPHINYRAGFGFTESLYIPIIILTIYFILNKNNKLVYLSFIFAGLLWWTRLEGVVILFVLTVIFFVVNKKSSKSVLKYFLCLMIFALVVSPILIQRNEQFEDPFYLYYNDHLFVEEYIGVGVKESEKTAENYIEEQGIFKFFERFVLTGSANVIEQTIRLSFPYLLILLPFGVLFSLRPFDQNSSYIKANWIVILVYSACMIIPLAVINERRFLFGLIPFIIIFSILPIQRLVEYGLSTFAFSKKQKNIFLVIILCVILLFSVTYMLRYDLKSYDEEHEKIEFAHFLENELDGIIMDPAFSRTFDHGYFSYAKLNNPPGNFKDFRILNDPVLSSGNQVVELNGKSIHEMISYGKSINAKYILVDTDNNESFLDDLYNEKIKKPFLIKIFDTQEQGFNKIKIKIFQIDYSQYNFEN